MDLFDSRYYRINKFLLSCIGHWVYQPIGQKRFTRFLMLLSLATGVLPEFYLTFSAWGDGDAMIECLPPQFIGIICISQFCVMFYIEKKLLKLVDCIKNDWVFWSSRKELKILQKDAELGRSFTILYAVNMYVTTFFFISMSLTPILLDIWIPLNETRPRQLVFPAKFPFDESKHFNWMLMHGSIVTFYNGTLLVCCESLLAVTTQHVCGLFAVISYRLKNVIKLTEERRNIQRDKHEINEVVATSIVWHSHAVEFARNLESCFSPLLFCTVGLNVLAVSILGITTLNSIGTLHKMVKHGVFAVGSLVHLYCITLPGQNLLNRSMEVADAAYNGCWYQLPMKSKKLLILIIMRSQIPCKLTVGKFCTMDMATYSALLKTSISYFTVFSSVTQKE